MKTKTWIQILTVLTLPIMTGCGGDNGVTPANHTPVAKAQSVTTDEDTVKTIVLAGTDEDNDSLSYTVTVNPAHGILSGTAPNLTYTPAADYYGSDSFSFKVNDGTIDSEVATVSISVTSVNDAPVAVAQNATTDENTAVVIILSGTDVDGDTLSYAYTVPGHGILSGTAPRLTYTPEADYYGTDSFKFKVNDGAVTSARASVNIIVNRVDDPPTLADSNGSVAENAEAGDAVATVTIVDTGDGPVTSMSLSGSGAANFDVAADGSVTVAAGAMLDYETCTEYNLTVTAASAAGTSNAVHLDINVSDYFHPFQIARLVADNAGENDTFGRAVAMSGDYIVVGVPYEDSNGEDAGSVYLFKRNRDSSVSMLARFQSDDIASKDHFGYAVSIDGDYIVVGAPDEDTRAIDAGSVYVFRRVNDTNITQIDHLTADNAGANDHFGHSVAISGDYIIVGAHYEDTGGSNAGSAYLFRRYGDSNISQIAQLTADSPSDNDWFGYSVAIDGDRMVVGAHRADTNGTDSGSAYVFVRHTDTNVTQTAHLTAADADTGDFFGYSVAISGDYIVVGAHLKDAGAGDSGSAYVFKCYSDSTIAQIARLTANSAGALDYFGYAVGISGNYIVVGAPREDTGGNDAGSIYLFERNSDANISQRNRLQGDNTGEGDWMGRAVAISGDYFVGGAYANDLSANNSGCAYLFDLEPAERPYIYSLPLLTLVHDEQIVRRTLVSLAGDSPTGRPITYVLGGIDAGAFALEDNNISFDPKANYEDPNDDDSNNDYNITVTASDAGGHDTARNMNILVRNQIYLDLAQLVADNPDSRDYFGSAVAISNDYIVIGVPSKDSNGSNSGSVYVFKRNSDTNTTQIAQLTAANAGTGDNFGASVAIDGDYIVVGAPYEDSNGTSSGSVYVFKRNSDTNITQIAHLTADDADSGDRFGYSVGISGLYIVVGAHMEDSGGSNAGSAYLFKRNSANNSITQIAHFKAGNSGSNDRFGVSVAISGDLIVAGAYWEDSDGTDSGSAYVFKHNSVDDSVTQIAHLRADDADEFDNFGYSVAISGEYIVVGAYQEDSNGTDSGSAYVFKHSSVDGSVTQIAHLTADNARAGDAFGWSVAMDGDYIVVGARMEDTEDGDAGSAYVFKHNNDSDIVQIAHLGASNPGTGDQFGHSVAVSGDYIVAGAYKEDSGSQDAGCAYLFKRDTN